MALSMVSSTCISLCTATAREARSASAGRSFVKVLSQDYEVDAH